LCLTWLFNLIFSIVLFILNLILSDKSTSNSFNFGSLLVQNESL
jgi:hypothetical protein